MKKEEKVNMVTKSYRVVGHVTRSEVMAVGDVRGHWLGIFESRGIAYIEDEVAVVTSWVHGDLTKGNGPMGGYTRYAYEDGSTIIAKTEYTCRLEPESKTVFFENGYGEFIIGTGRFAGIEGSSSWKGRQVVPRSEETKGDWIVEGTMAYVLSSP